MEHVRTDADFAALCGTTVAKLTRWLDGQELPDIELMGKLCERTGLDLDWIFLGKYNGIDAPIAIRLRAMLDDVPLGLAAAGEDRPAPLLRAARAPAAASSIGSAKGPLAHASGVRRS